MPLVVNRPIGSKPAVGGGQPLVLATPSGAFSIPFGTHRHITLAIYELNKNTLEDLYKKGQINIIGRPREVPVKVAAPEVVVEPEDVTEDSTTQEEPSVATSEDVTEEPTDTASEDAKVVEETTEDKPAKRGRRPSRRKLQ